MLQKNYIECQGVGKNFFSIIQPKNLLKQWTATYAVTPAMVGDLNPPPTLMPTARLLTNGAQECGVSRCGWNW